MIGLHRSAVEVLLLGLRRSALEALAIRLHRSARALVFACGVLLMAAGLRLLAPAPALAEGRVHDAPESVEPLPVGAAVPPVTVRGLNGGVTNLAERTAERGALLVFYRGGW